ncbi:hypothetical protein [Hydrogenophaga sp.]|uniref:hypothetical protein n=1 Tax=Hydrogenophaga sp. TaxID=1904254 RepID=UPI002AB8196C|nr:hypothetical protein [Hydrogenophaga sp.]MDZ4397978.1 hypothetical protein [Hydrogenophaga sp.]
MTDRGLTVEVLRQAAAAHQEPDPVKRALLQAVWSCLHDSEELRHRCRVDPASLRRVQVRALTEAAQMLSPENGTGWAAAGMLERAIKRFAERVWEFHKADASSLGPVDTLLHEAFLAGDVPRTQRRLYELIRTDA